MKRLFILPVMVFAISGLCAQKKVSKLPGFGKVEISELKMTECPFEKDAGAMVIFNSGESIFQLTGLEQTEHHVRIKIFNQKGFDKANIKIRYPVSGNDVTIKKLTAQTYNLDASGNMEITKVEKNSIFDKKISKYTSEISFAFPNVKAGSVIEYKYILDGRSEGVWYFQKDIPVLLSRFSLNFPTQLIVNAVPYCSLPLDKVTGYESMNEFSTYTMENIPGLPDEPFMSCREDYLQRIEARLIAIDFPGEPRRTLLKTWPKIVKEIMEDEDFGIQLKKNIPRTADLDAQLKLLTEPFQKMCAIHKYVRENMEWNKQENIWALDGVKSAWKDKKGTSGEINLILINLLRDADLEAHPLLVSTRDNGMVNTSIAGYSQFNKVMAYVNISGNKYVLDATEKDNPSYLIPQEVIASEGLVIEKYDSFEWGWTTLWNPVHKKKKNIFINADVTDADKLKGFTNITLTDYAKAEAIPLVKQGNKELIDKLAAGTDIKIDSFELEGNLKDSMPVKEHFEFLAGTRASGDYHYFTMNLFTGLEKNPFLADERMTDIFFGPTQDYEISGTVILPDGYKMDELPKNVKLIMPDTSIVFTRRSSFNQGILSVGITLQFRVPVYGVSDYDYFKEFYKKLFEFLNESFVYTKK